MPRRGRPPPRRSGAGARGRAPARGPGAFSCARPRRRPPGRTWRPPSRGAGTRGASAPPPPARRSLARAGEHARHAEELGFDSVWISDPLVYSFGRYGGPPDPVAAVEPMTALAGIAAVTERVRIGSLVLCAPFRHPAIVAKMAATI